MKLALMCECVIHSQSYLLRPEILVKIAIDVD